MGEAGEGSREKPETSKWGSGHVSVEESELYLKSSRSSLERVF